MLELPSFALCLTFLIFLFMVVKHLRKPYKNLPPGPWKLPILGNLHQLIGTLPHHCLRNLAKKHGPIMHLKLGERSAIIISSSSTAEAVLKTNELNFAQRPKLLAVDIMGYGGAGIVFAPYGDYWRQIRKFCIMELLSTRRVQSFRSVREEEVQNLIQSISSCSKHVINLSEKISLLTNSITSRAAFGNKCKDADEFIAVIKAGIELAGGFDMPDVFPFLRFLPFISGMKPKLEKMHLRMDKVLDNIINEHKAKRATSDVSKEKDLVDVLLKLQETNDIEFPIITTNNIKAIILDIFSAGTETSATTMEWAMSEMLKNPKVMQKAQEEVRQVLTRKKNIAEEDVKELQYLKLVIKETLRLHPPTPLSTRQCREKCEINGYEIPMKAKVIINLWAIGRDPEHWPDADCFLPERFEGSTMEYNGTNFEYIPFGAGRRICPGISFASTTIELSLALLLYHFNWRLPDGLEPNKLDMSEAFGISVKMKNPLYVIATPSSYT